jgi:hypothetical protein
MVYFMIKILVLIFSVASFAANEPMFIKNQQGGAKEKIRDFQAPNNLATKLTADQFLVETGNNNILSNPSFEHETVSSSWTDNGTDTGIATAVAVVHGKKAIGFLPVARSVNLIQSSTLYAAQFADGVQGLAMVRIKSDVAVKVCSIQAGTVSTTNCVTTNTDLKWGLYKVPFILGGTSNGISISTNGALVTGTVLVDDAFVGAVDLQAITSFDTTCPTLACETSFSALIVTGGSVQNENVNWLSTQSGTTTKTANFNAGIFTVAPNCTATLYITASPAMSARVLSTTASAVNLQTPDYNGNLQDGSLSLSCNKQGADYTAAIAARAEYQKTQVASYSSNNADTDWAACSFSTLAWQGLGTVTNFLECRRDGADLLIRGYFTLGTVAAAEARIPLPLWNGLQLTNKKVATIGRLFRNVGTGSTTKNHTIYAPTTGLSYLTVGTTEYVIASAPSTAQNGNALFNSSEVILADMIRIPINGWEQSNIIIGQFNGLQTCTDTLACTDTFSVDVSSTGVVTKENVNWINGNCTNSSAGVYSCPFNSGIFTVAPNCVSNGQLQGGTYATGSVGSADLAIRNTGGVLANGQFTLVCQKQGADYIGKTAMAVASDQNVRSIGSTNVDIQGVIFGSGANCATACSTGTCTICNQTGSKITSVTWSATGVYDVNGLDGTKYICTGAGRGTSYVPIFTSRQSGTSSLVKIHAGSVTGLFNAADGTIICIGIP